MTNVLDGKCCINMFIRMYMKNILASKQCHVAYGRTKEKLIFVWTRHQCNFKSNRINLKHEQRWPFTLIYSKFSPSLDIQSNWLSWVLFNINFIKECTDLSHGEHTSSADQLSENAQVSRLKQMQTKCRRKWKVNEEEKPETCP